MYMFAARYESNFWSPRAITIQTLTLGKRPSSSVFLLDISPVYVVKSRYGKRH
jgi:hypothetical protein